MPVYETLSEAVDDLRSRGFTVDLNLAFDKLKCHETGVCLSPNQFDIVEYYRFKGNANPSDEDIVFAISSKDSTIKGTLVSSYGAYQQDLSEELIKKLSLYER